MLPRAKWEIVRISPETISAVEAGEQGIELPPSAQTSQKAATAIQGFHLDPFRGVPRREDDADRYSSLGQPLAVTPILRQRVARGELWNQPDDVECSRSPGVRSPSA
jgi:hypothetical protein